MPQESQSLLYFRIISLRSADGMVHIRTAATRMRERNNSSALFTPAQNRSSGGSDRRALEPGHGRVSAFGHVMTIESTVAGVDASMKRRVKRRTSRRSRASRSSRWRAWSSRVKPLSAPVRANFLLDSLLTARVLAVGDGGYRGAQTGGAARCGPRPDRAIETDPCPGNDPQRRAQTVGKQGLTMDP